MVSLTCILYWNTLGVHVVVMLGQDHIWWTSVTTTPPHHDGLAVLEFRQAFWDEPLIVVLQTNIKESFSFKTRMPGTVKCRPTVAY